MKSIQRFSFFQIVIITVLGSLILWFGKTLITHPLYHSDFRVFYSSGHIFRENPKLLYDAGAQEAVQKAYFPSLQAPYQSLSFINPPFFATVFVPLTFFTPNVSYLLFVALNILLYLYLLDQILLELQSSPKQRFFLILFSLSFAPFYVTLLHAQSSILSLGLFYVLYKGLQQQKSHIPALAASLLFYKPQLAFFAVLFQIIQGNKKSLLWTGILMFGLFLFSLILLRGDIALFLTHLFSYIQGNSSLEESAIHMVSWQGFFFQLKYFFPALPAKSLALIVSILTAGIVVAVVGKTKKTSYLSWCIILVLSVLSGMHIHIHDGLLILPSLLFLFHQKANFINRALVSLGWLIFLLTYFSPFYPNPFFFIPTLYILCLLGYLLHVQWEKRKKVSYNEVRV